MAKVTLFTYEKAFSGQAVIKKFFIATFLERKIMSTKTSFKRIALVAASALAIGGFTAVSPANAAVTAATLKVSGAFGTGTGTAAGTQVVGGIMEMTLAETSTTGVLGTFTSTGVGSITAYTAGATTTAPASTTYPTTSLTLTTSANHASAVNQVINLSSSVAGVQTITFTPIAADGSPGTAISAKITWGAAAALNSAFVTSQIAKGTNASGGVGTLTTTGNRYTGDDASVSAPSTAVATAGNEVAVIGVALASAYDTPFSATIGASISGAGTISITEDTTSQSTGMTPGTASTGTAVNSAAKNQFYRVSVFADGRAGVGTITITSGTTTIATKTVTFFTTATKATATQNLFVAKAGRVAGAQTGTQNYAVALTGATVDGTNTNQDGTAAFTVALVDANGNAATPAATPAVVSSSSAVIVSNGCTAVTAKVGVYQCSVSGAGGATSGQSATVTFSMPATSTEVADATTGLFSLKAAALTFTIGGSPVAVTAALSASELVAGASAVLTLSATDSKGNKAYDADYAALLAGTMTSTVANPATTLPGAAISLINGSSDNNIYAPVSEGDFTISGKTGADTGAGAAAVFSASGTVGAVSSSASLALDAANAATDAANNAYDEAQNATQAASDALAAVTALAKQVKSLIASVKKLSAAVAKLR
jgi:hypothetical protein